LEELPFDENFEGDEHAGEFQDNTDLAGSGRQLVPPSEADSLSPRKTPRSVSMDSGREHLEDKILQQMQQETRQQQQQAGRRQLDVSEEREQQQHCEQRGGGDHYYNIDDDDSGSPPPLMPLSPQSGNRRMRSPAARARGRQLERNSPSAASQSQSPTRPGLALAPPGQTDFGRKNRKPNHRPVSGRALARAPQPPAEAVEENPPPPRHTRSVGRKNQIPLFKRMEMQRAAEVAHEQDEYKKKLLRKQMGPYMAQEILPDVKPPGKTPNRQRMHFAASVSGPSSNATTGHTAQPEDIVLPSIHKGNHYPYHRYKSSCKPLSKAQMNNWLLRKEAPLRPGGPR